jgi:aminoglycoside phosphotransferase (APT) family kinase protein
MAKEAAPPDRLASMLGGILGGSVRDLRRLSGGASRSTWSFDLLPGEGAGGGARPLVAQLQRDGSEAAASRMAAEADLLRLARARGVPVPAVVASGDDEGLGRPYVVLERVEGETIPRKLLRDTEFEIARGRMLEQCASALAGVHSIPPSAVPDLPAGDQLEEMGALLHGLGQPRPALELCLRKLAPARPAPLRTTVVHGDFRNGNLLVGPEGLRAVLDWELAHVGDPLEDLGWFCVRAWRFGSAAPAGGYGSVEKLLEAYESCSGQGVEREAVRWWEAFGTFRWAVICMLQAATHLSGQSRSVELATIGRRVCESEWDLLALLGASPSDAPLEAGAGDATAHEARLVRAGRKAAPSEAPATRPTAGELVEAVEEYLAGDVAPSTAGRVRFHARVAQNALGIVRRELVLGPAVAARHRDRLDRLGFRDDEELARSIRQGDCDARWEEMAGALSSAARDQLLVANPRHLEPDRPLEG